MSEDSTMTIEPEEYLIREGEESTQMYFLQSGTMAVFKRKGDSTIQIGTIYSGEVVGEMSFLDELPRSASVRARVDSEVLVIPHKKFIDVLDGQPRWFRSLMKTLSQRLRHANKMVARKSVEEDPEKKNEAAS